MDKWFDIPVKIRTGLLREHMSQGHSYSHSRRELEGSLAKYQQGGEVSSFPNWDKIKASLNPKNWRVEDYTDKGEFSEAYSSARQAGEKEFMWNGKRFNTDYEGTPAQQLKETGITNDQTGDKSFAARRLQKNMFPFEYNSSGNSSLLQLGSPAKRLFNTVVLNKSEYEHEKLIDLNDYFFGNGNANGAKDAFNLYLGFPQKNDSFGISEYSPSVREGDESDYFYNHRETDEAINNMIKFGNLLGSANRWNRKSDLVEDINKTNADPNRVFTNSALGTYKIDHGEDSEGKYISYYDSWDLNPYRGEWTNSKNRVLEKMVGDKEDISAGVGKPFEIYNRIYYRENEDYGNKFDAWYQEYRSYEKEFNQIKPDDAAMKLYKKPFNSLSEAERLNILDKIDERRIELADKMDSLLAKVPQRYTRQYFSDKKLLGLDPNNKDFDTLALQRELTNRGVSLPKSTKEDGSLDGIYGEETKKALLDYIEKMKRDSK